MSNKLVLFISLLIFLVPFLFWGSAYSVGGDDSKLYYLFPVPYLTNFTSSIVSNNQPGTLGYYFSQSYITPFAFILSFVQLLLPSISLQKLFLGLNLSLSFVGSYLFVREVLTPMEVKRKNLIALLGGLFYTFSTFSYYTIWNHQLFSVYLSSFIPLAFYLFSKTVNEKKTIYVLLLGLLAFIYSFTLYSIPWILATLLSVTPLFIYWFLEQPKVFLKFGGLAVVLIVGVNIHWIFPFIYSPFSSSQKADFISTVIDGESRVLNTQTIIGVAQNNSLLYPMAQIFHPLLQKNFSWSTYQTHTSWYQHLFFANLIFLLIVIAAAVLVFREKVAVQKIFFFSLLSWLIALFFFTVKIESWGLPLFLLLNDYIPGFTMFRNMYDKFGLGLALTFSLVFSLSLAIVCRQLSERKSQLLLVVTTVIIILNAVPFILGSFYKLPYGDTGSIYNRISTFNSDFSDLLDYLNELDTPSRVLWLPLNAANYVIIGDSENQNYYYMGVSPLHYLTPTNDFTGYLSFPGKVGQEVRNSIERHDLPALGTILQKLNVEYVILNHDIPPDVQQSYLYTATISGDVFKQQSPELQSSIIGEQLAVFGDRYELYRINDHFQNQKIFITDAPTLFPNSTERLSFSKISEYLYVIQLPPTTHTRYLVFLDPYHDQWTLYTDKNLTQPLAFRHSKVHDYANLWEVKPDGIPADGIVYLYFKPQRFVLLAWSLSGLVILVILVGILKYAARKR